MFCAWDRNQPMTPPCPQAIPEVSPPQQDSDSFEAPFLQQHIQGQVTGPTKKVCTHALQTISE